MKRFINIFWLIKQSGFEYNHKLYSTFDPNKPYGEILDYETKYIRKSKNNNIFEGKEEPIVEQTDNFNVHGYPCPQHPYNPIFDVQKQLPIYTKTPKSKSMFCAGYYIICFDKGWRKAYCPKAITLQRYPYKGPIKSKIEMQQILNNAIKNFTEKQNSNSTNWKFNKSN